MHALLSAEVLPKGTACTKLTLSTYRAASKTLSHADKKVKRA